MNSTAASALAFTLTLLASLAICVVLALGFAQLAEFSAEFSADHCTTAPTDFDCQMF